MRRNEKRSSGLALLASSALYCRSFSGQSPRHRIIINLRLEKKKRKVRLALQRPFCNVHHERLVRLMKRVRRLVFALGVQSFGAFSAVTPMCRVRFGLTGIYFDSLEPSRAREEVCQPLISALPPMVQNKQCDVLSKVIVDGAIKTDVVSAKGKSEDNKVGGQRQSIKDQSDSSSSSPIDEEGHSWAKNAKKNQASVGSKRARDLSSSSSSSVASSSSSSSSNDEGQSHESANSEISRLASKDSKRVNSPTQKQPDKISLPGTHKASKKSSKAPPAKRVRFAMDVQERIVPSDDASDTSSSHSSDDSYTDPPSPTEPYDAFAGYFRTPGASRSHRMDGRIAGSRMRLLPVEGDVNTDGADDFLDSEDGSEVDVQGLPVKGRPLRTVRAAATGQTLDQRHHQNNSTPLARSKHSVRAIDQSRVMGGGLGGNVDSGLHPEKSQASQKGPMLPLRSGGPLRYPKLHSGKNLPEPIFVVRPRFMSDAKEEGKPADVLNSREHSRGFSKKRPAGVPAGTKVTKIPPPRSIQVKKIKNPKYRPPSVSDDSKRDAEFDEDLGMLIRDV